jgi:hypothetical protein
MKDGSAAEHIVAEVELAFGVDYALLDGLADSTAFMIGGGTGVTACACVQDPLWVLPSRRSACG